MKTLIVGATGFIGFNLATKLGNAYITGRPGENNPPGQLIADTDPLPQVDCLIHLSAITDTLVRSTALMYQANWLRPISLFKKAIDGGCKRIIYASSCSVYDSNVVPFRESDVTHPLTPYAVSKAHLDYDASILAELTGATIIGLRFSNVYQGHTEKHKGNASSMIYQLYQQMLSGNPKLFRDGSQRRDFVHVSDVVDAIVLAMRQGQSGVYNIGSGVSTTFNEIVRLINQENNLHREVEYIDCPIEKVYQHTTIVDISKARHQLDYSPKVDLISGIRAMSLHHLANQ